MNVVTVTRDTPRDKGLVSKETVVLHQWQSRNEYLVSSIVFPRLVI